MAKKSNGQPETATLDIGKLKPWDRNPRSITLEALAGLGASIERFGLVEPVVVNRRGWRVVGGHQRLKVLQARGVKKVACVLVDLPPTEEKALALALNARHIAGDWTPDVAALLAELKVELPDLPPALDLDAILKDLPALIEAPEEFPAVDESLLTAFKCPKCGYEWSGKPGGDNAGE